MDLLVFFRTAAPLLTSLIIFTVLFILLAKSIKKHSKIYYFVFSIPFFMHAIPTILRWFGVEMEFSFIRVPVLGEIIRDYIHMGSLGHPLMIIIMYMGALDMRNPYVKKLMSIRKEISIISGFPILTHSLVRTVNNWPNSLKYFTNHAEFMDNPRITSELGAGISNVSLFLGIVMLVLFIPLWVTSFDSIRKRMGFAKWKKLQRWSYGLYALMFIHAIGIQVGGMLSRNAAMEQRARTELAEAQQTGQGGRPAELSGSAESGGRNRGERPSESGEAQQGGRPSAGGESTAVSGQQQAGPGGQQAPSAGPPRRGPSKGIPDIVIPPAVRSYISISVLLLIYGSYLFLRVRKARKKASGKSVLD